MRRNLVVAKQRLRITGLQVFSARRLNDDQWLRASCCGRMRGTEARVVSLGCEAIGVAFVRGSRHDAVYAE